MEDTVYIIIAPETEKNGPNIVLMCMRFFVSIKQAQGHIENTTYLKNSSRELGIVPIKKSYNDPLPNKTPERCLTEPNWSI